MVKLFCISFGLGYGLLSLFPQGASALNVIWSDAGQQRVLKTWSLEQLHGYKMTSHHEKDPESGHILSWKGVVLSRLLEEAAASLTVEERARIDLVIVQGVAAIPRAMILKYPFLLAIDDNASRGPLYSVVPWTSKPKILNEVLPLERFFVSHVDKIELTNYADRYGSLYLKRRTDPLAIRGEKLFVQSCVNCHSGGTQNSINFGNVGSKHPPVKGVFPLVEHLKRSISRYLDAYRAQVTSVPHTPPLSSVSTR